MKDEKEKKNFEVESEELNIEALTEIQGGIEVDVKKEGCGLGCYIGTGSGGVDKAE